MAQMTSQPKSKQREILNWPIREQENIITLVISQSALAQVISQSALARFLGSTGRLTNQTAKQKKTRNFGRKHATVPSLIIRGASRILLSSRVAVSSQNPNQNIGLPARPLS